jgi:Ca2+-binding EF-hand superfamily protein
MTPCLAAQQQQAAGNATMTEESFVMWDTDKDEYISMQEFTESYTGEDAQQKFKMMDKDGDGKLSKQEFAQIRPEKRKEINTTQPNHQHAF